ncbi:MAG TPA: hypothetical protein VMV97_10565 [Sulfuriferula sp.]|nr:hypothetical protein [Sulfuriferula sp.]
MQIRFAADLGQRVAAFQISPRRASFDVAFLCLTVGCVFPPAQIITPLEGKFER